MAETIGPATAIKNENITTTPVSSHGYATQIKMLK
jgi:hypothetical protein